MRTLLLLLGGLLLAATLVLLIFYRSDSIGSIWATIDPNSLVGFGSLVEKQIHPMLWVDVILPVMQWELWAMTLILALVLGFIAMRTGGRRRRRWR